MDTIKTGKLGKGTKVHYIHENKYGMHTLCPASSRTISEVTVTGEKVTCDRCEKEYQYTQKIKVS